VTKNLWKTPATKLTSEFDFGMFAASHRSLNCFLYMTFTLQGTSSY